jgi:hypothetical protein
MPRRFRFLPKLLFLLLLLTAFHSILVAAPPVIGGCDMFPADNPWNTDISSAPVHPLSDVYIDNINANGGDYLHADFGEDPSYGIPWTTVDASQPTSEVSFDYADESDFGPYPIPEDLPIEAGGDRHALIVETTNCILYELYALEEDGGEWYAGSGAIFDLSSNALRPDGWTSADAAGLPILPGLARCDEAEAGVIDHALRFTVSRTQKAYVYPATHFASSITDPAYPPMGLRLRMKASYDISGLTGQALAVATALKKYGMIVADNGSNWFISGETNPDCWNDDELNQLKNVPGTAFEVIVSPPPPAEDGNLIPNSGFEGADMTKQALGWQLKNGSGEKRICDSLSAIDGVYKEVSIEGYCAYKFKGIAGERSKLKQKTGVSGHSSGEPFGLYAFANGSNLPAGTARLIAKMKYAEGTKEKWTVALGAGSFDFTLFLLPVTFTGTPTQLTAILDFKGNSGKVVVDDVNLVPEVSTTAGLLPLP